MSTTNSQTLINQLDDCLRRDRLRLAQRLKRLPKDADARSKALEKFSGQIQRSKGLRQQRQQALSNISYPAELPVSQARDELLKVLADNQVVIVCGDTGSGKSTQLPKLLLELGYGVDGMIAHTQPRRIAARSIAVRLAEELNAKVGDEVGFKVRFSDQVQGRSRVKLLTDGMLLAELQQDRKLDQYDAIIIDEAHERSLNIDFLLGYLRGLRKQRPDLKIVITSATIDPERFSKHFDKAPIVRVAGRTYPVELRYRPLLTESKNDEDRDQDIDELQGITQAVTELWREKPGNTLVFLAGERQIHETKEELERHFRHSRGASPEILPLYSRLPLAQQNAALAADGRLKIVLATNVAETSLTVPGMRYVIDPGTARLSRYRPHSQVQGLAIEAISQASANQRSGRCGRVAPGIAIRLYSEEDFLNRPEFTDPEIRRTNLAQVILQMQSLGLGTVQRFPFLESPDGRQVNHAMKALQELGALTADHRLTDLGREMARIPVDPRIGRLLLAGREQQCAPEMAVLAAALATQDPRERPNEARQAADTAHKVDVHKKSDYLSLLNLWRRCQAAKSELSNSQFRKWCRENFIGFLRFREWQDVHRQLQEWLPEAKQRPIWDAEHCSEQQPYARIHSALLAGLITQVGELTTKGHYRGVRNQQMHIFPGSALFGRKPKWLLTFMTVETTKAYARMTAELRPEWIETVAAHLLKSHYLEPHFAAKRQQVVAREQVSLYSLVLSSSRQVEFGRHEPVAAREIFIREALVSQQLRTRLKFWQHNLKIQADIEVLEAKSRRRDLLADDETVYQYYADRLPSSVVSTATLEKWHRQASKDNPKLLFMRPADLLQRQPNELESADFPDHIEVDGIYFGLEYGFEPGSQQDGITVLVPLPQLNQLPAERLEWLVPGLLADKIEALLRALPKARRKNFVPVPDYARACVERLSFGQGDFLNSLTEQLQNMSGLPLTRDDWQTDSLPAHLQMHIRVVDEKGNEIESSSALPSLQKEHGKRASAALRETLDNAQPHELERELVERWDFGDLPETVSLQRGGITLRACPALTWKDERLQLQLFDKANIAADEHRRGLVRLYGQHLRAKLKYLHQQLPDIDRSELNFSKMPDTGAPLPPPLPATGQRGNHPLEEDLLCAALSDCCDVHGPLVRQQQDFLDRVTTAETQLIPTATELAKISAELGVHYRELRKSIDKLRDFTLLPIAQDAREQLDRLIYRGFLQRTPAQWRPRLSVYVRGIDARLTRISGRIDVDQQRQNEILRYWLQYQKLRDKHAINGSDEQRQLIEQLRWMIEEYRVSLWAQHLGTVAPISAKRLDKIIAQIG